MGRPIARADFLGDQFVGGFLIRNAQQRFGEAHQRQPLGIAEAELFQKAFDDPPPAVERAGMAHQIARFAERAGAFFGR